MIVREQPRDWPDDGGHVKDLETAGAVVIRGDAASRVAAGSPS